MALLTDAVRIGITGELYEGAVGSTGPTTSVSALDTAFTGLGYVDEEGVEEAYEDTVDEFYAWQGSTVVRASTSKSKATLKLRLIETKGKTLELYHPGSEIAVVSAGEWKLDVVGPTPDPRAFVLDVLDDTKHLRIYVRNGKITEREPIKYAGTELVGFAVTIICLPVGGIILTKFSDDAHWGYS